MMKPIPIMRTGYLSSYVYALRVAGIDPDPLLKQHQLPPEIEILPGYMLSARDVHAFVKNAAGLACPGTISSVAGFHNARCEANPFSEGATQAKNLLEAIERHNNLVAAYGPGARFTLDTGATTAKWSKVTRSPLPDTEIFAVASLIGHIRSFFQQRWQPECVELAVAAPDDLTLQPQFAGVSFVRSSDSGTHIHFPVEHLRRPPKQRPEPAGCHSMTGQLEEPDFVESVHLLMKGLARSGCLSIERTASAARMTVRTLQRRLREAGVSHSTLADQVRLEVSSDLLATAHEMTVTEIGFELGYRDPGSFSRAFRRLAGMPPAEFRRLRKLPIQNSQMKPEELSAAAAPH